MPCYHFVFHAYGTWHPDHPAGWHEHDGDGTLRPSQAIADNRRAIQRFPAVSFDLPTQLAMVNMAVDACTRRGWRPCVIATNPTHLHLVAAWTGKIEPLEVQHKVKNLLGLRAAEANGTKGRPWLSHGGKPRRVRDHEHLRQLVEDYLREQGGMFWKEGDPVPVWPSRESNS